MGGNFGRAGFSVPVRPDTRQSDFPCFSSLVLDNAVWLLVTPNPAICRKICSDVAPNTRLSAEWRHCCKSCPRSLDLPTDSGATSQPRRQPSRSSAGRQQGLYQLSFYNGGSSLLVIFLYRQRGEAWIFRVHSLRRSRGDCTRNFQCLSHLSETESHSFHFLNVKKHIIN